MSALKPYRTISDTILPRLKRPRNNDFRILDRIRQRAKKLAQLNANRLKLKFSELRHRVQTEPNSKLRNHFVVESFALMTESVRRVTGKIYYDCQLLGGLSLVAGSIAEMQTGEGKTITVGLAAAFNSIFGKGVHVATTNAYLAERDHEELAPIFRLLGISSGLITSEQDEFEKHASYRCDVTYGTGFDFGFDFLKDQIRQRPTANPPLGKRFLDRIRSTDTSNSQTSQRELAFAIIDEADSVLLDEATTPLILSGQPKLNDQTEVFEHAFSTANRLVENRHFRWNRETHSIRIHEKGIEQVNHQIPAAIKRQLTKPWHHYIEQCLRAKFLFERGIHYIVKNQQVVIVDQNTGRLHDERKWKNGLHQAIETKEKVAISKETSIAAQITRQKYFSRYQHVSGITGTAAGNENELFRFYHLPVVKIHRNKPSKRIGLKTRYFADHISKYQAIAKSVKKIQGQGQPVLIGTKTIAQTETLSQVLDQAAIEHKVLNGIQTQNEACIIAASGDSGVVTIATNMAGRGTDIRLSEEARKAGGLHVIVVEHHESRRVDRQIIGRTARQDDPGSYQVFVSAEDDILTKNASELVNSIRQHSDSLTGECYKNFDSKIRRLQIQLEKAAYAARKSLVLRDKWLEKKRESMAKLATI
ncbi:MAG: hypothetical protein AAF623_15365 [Planctomycetota bacterium]